MRRLLAACLLLAGLLGPLTASAFGGRDPYKHFFHETFGDFTEELQRARDEGKEGIFIFFEMDECPFCHYMKQNVLNQRKVQEYYRENFLNFTVDIEGDIEVTTFQGKTMPQKDFAFKINRVRATPVLAFYDLEGDRIFRYTGRTSGVDEFMAMGRYVVEGAYEDTPFTRYKRERRESRR
ncbi:MAG TPA: thioredoxin family protein [Gammaproteobacteria bacterium]|nr:thioredoxin family protein [Gammaproteobacteria bacterium]